MARYCALAWLITSLILIGCRSASVARSSNSPTPSVGINRASESRSRPFHSTVAVPSVTVAFHEPLPDPEGSGPSPPEEAATEGEELIPPEAEEEPGPDAEFGLHAFVAAVVDRHPSVQAMAAAWQAVVQRYPQVVSLDDPMFMAMTAPASLDSNDVEEAYVLELRQKFPWFGKLKLRGEVANQEAFAAAHEIDDARIEVALTAQVAYIDYYLADRQLTLNVESTKLMTQFREIAQTRYRTNLVTQQDVLQADLELAELARRKLELERMRRVSTARMNALLLRDPSLPFPAPHLPTISRAPIVDASLLQAWALQNRPDLAAQSHRIEVESANVALAYKEYFPDAEVYGRYDTFWQPASTQEDLRSQVGMTVNLPIYHHRLNAAVAEAEFRLQQQRAQYAQLMAKVQVEVQTAIEQVAESEQAVSLYERRLLPAAEQYLAAVRSNYEVGKSTSLDFVQAQRQLLSLREKQVEANSTMAQRTMELKRSLGGTLPFAAR